MTRRVAALALLFAAVLCAAKKKDKTETAQVLKESPDPPAVTFGHSERLAFHVSPLSARGLLSQQTRDALAALMKAAGGSTIVHLRAFVAGSGDLRRIGQITGEVFSRKNLALPSLSVVQVGALPMTGAQIVIEAVSEARRQGRGATGRGAAEGGLMFIPLQNSPEELMGRIGTLRAVSISCFVDDAAKAEAVNGALAGKYPGAVITVVQTQRLPPRPFSACEGVVRSGQAAELAFSGTQAAFGFEEKDAMLAFQRVGKMLSTAGVGAADVVTAHVYALNRPIAEMALKVKTMGGESAAVPVEGVAGSDASFAVDVVAIKR